jgi:serine/alanine adding enzyme
MSRVTEDRPLPQATALRVVRELDEGAWAEFVDHHPHGSIFHTPEMYRVLERTRHHRPSVWAAVAGDEIRALMTVVEIATLGGPLRPLTSRPVAFAIPLTLDGSDGEPALQALLGAYRRRSSRIPLFTEIRNHVDASRMEAQLSLSGFRHERHLNFLVDLTPSEDELWARVSSSARRNIKKARRMGVTIDAAADHSEAAGAYEILRDVYHRIQVPLPDRSLFDASLEILGPLGNFRLLVAKVEGRPIGVLSLLLYKDVVYYWYTGTLREYAGHRAGDLLVWQAITDGKASGCTTLDFGGAGRPDEPYGVRDFKAKYGGQLVDFGRDVWSSAPVRLRLSRGGYSLARRFLS